MDLTLKTDLTLLIRYVTPAEIRRAGRKRLTEYLARAGGLPAKGIQTLVDKAVTAATEQRVSIPGDHSQQPNAAVIRGLPGMWAILNLDFLAVAGGISRFPTDGQLASAATEHARKA